MKRNRDGITEVECRNVHCDGAANKKHIVERLIIKCKIRELKTCHTWNGERKIGVACSCRDEGAAIPDDRRRAGASKLIGDLNRCGRGRQ